MADNYANEILKKELNSRQSLPTEEEVYGRQSLPTEEELYDKPVLVQRQEENGIGDPSELLHDMSDLEIEVEIHEELDKLELPEEAQKQEDLKAPAPVMREEKQDLGDAPSVMQAHILKEENIETKKQAEESSVEEQSALKEMTDIEMKALISDTSSDDISDMSFKEMTEWALAQAKIKGATPSFRRVCDGMRDVFLKMEKFENHPEAFDDAQAIAADKAILELRKASADYISTHRPWFKKGKMRKKMVQKLSEGQPSMLDRMAYDLHQKKHAVIVMDKLKTEHPENPYLNVNGLNPVIVHDYFINRDKIINYYGSMISGQKVSTDADACVKAVEKKLKGIYGDQIDSNRCVFGLLKKVDFDVEGNPLPEYRDADAFNTEFINALLAKDRSTLQRLVDKMGEELLEAGMKEELLKKENDTYIGAKYCIENFSEYKRITGIGLRLIDNFEKTFNGDKINMDIHLFGKDKKKRSMFDKIWNYYLQADVAFRGDFNALTGYDMQKLNQLMDDSVDKNEFKTRDSREKEMKRHVRQLSMTKEPLMGMLETVRNEFMNSEEGKELSKFQEERQHIKARLKELKEQNPHNPAISEGSVIIEETLAMRQKMTSHYRAMIKPEISGRYKLDRVFDNFVKPVRFDESGEVQEGYKENDKWNLDYVKALNEGDFVLLQKIMNGLVDEVMQQDMDESMFEYNYVMEHFEDVYHMMLVGLSAADDFAPAFKSNGIKFGGEDAEKGKAFLKRVGMWTDGINVHSPVYARKTGYNIMNMRSLEDEIKRKYSDAERDGREITPEEALEASIEEKCDMMANMCRPRFEEALYGEKKS